MKALFFFAALLFSDLAMAQTLPECRMLTEHRPEADVAFKPGEDAKGKKVVPADINASPIGQEDPIVIPLTVDLAQRLGNQGVTGLQLETTTGFLEVSKNGRVTYNGQDITSQTYAVCATGGSGGTNAKPPEVDEREFDGQKPGDTIKYAPQDKKNSEF